MSNLVEFAFEGYAVRVELDEQGEPLFNTNDVCAVLEFGNPWDALSRHVDEEDLVKREVLTDGEPWFVAADVAAALGYAETYSVTRYLSDDETYSAKLADQEVRGPPI